MPEAGESPKVPGSRDVLKDLGFQVLFTVPSWLAVGAYKLLQSYGVDVIIAPEQIFIGTYLLETGFYHLARFVGKKPSQPN